MRRLPNWYEAAYNGEGTNNGLEALNRSIKAFETKHRILTLVNFFDAMFCCIRDRSRLDTNHQSWTHEFTFNRGRLRLTIGHDTKAIGWLNKIRSESRIRYPNPDYVPRHYLIDGDFYIGCINPMDAARVKGCFGPLVRVDFETE
jgi:hypothetical protein